ncbi:MAG: ParB/RepB/Spo0J family partition protein, partial [Firmicutes bacterium]|nr:ParB/RepB/Spo0J family partition protein [Bacillota bacterium]
MKDNDNQEYPVQKLPVSSLVPFNTHPFKVTEDESMLRTMESIAMFGVLTPLIARPLEDGKYEIISGHRRAHAAESIGLREVPVIVRNMDDDMAAVLVVDSNLQRENILPSERAFAYKMKNEAMKRSAGRPAKENGGQVDHHFQGRKTVDLLGEQTGESAKQIQRFIRL